MRATRSSPPYEAGHHPEAGVDLWAVSGALWRRKGLILVVVLLVTGLAFLATQMLTPRYAATATLMLDAPGRQALDGSAADALPGDAALIPTQLGLLRSPALARQVIEALGLEGDPEFGPAEPSVARLRRTLAEQPLTAELVEALWPSPPTTRPRTVEQTVVPAFLHRLSVWQQGESRVVNVSFRSRDPEKAARVANAVVEQHLANETTLRRGALDRAR